MTDSKKAMNDVKTLTEVMDGLRRSMNETQCAMNEMDKQIRALAHRVEDEINGKNPNMVRLIVKGLSSPQSMWVERSTTIDNLKILIYHKTGLSSSSQKLMTDAAINLTDHTKSIQSYGLQSNDIIHVLLPFRSIN